MYIFYRDRSFYICIHTIEKGQQIIGTVLRQILRWNSVKFGKSIIWLCSFTGLTKLYLYIIVMLRIITLNNNIIY